MSPLTEKRELDLSYLKSGGLWQVKSNDLAMDFAPYFHHFRYHPCSHAYNSEELTIITQAVCLPLVESRATDLDSRQETFPSGIPNYYKISDVSVALIDRNALFQWKFANSKHEDGKIEASEKSKVGKSCLESARSAVSHVVFCTASVGRALTVLGVGCVPVELTLAPLSRLAPAFV